MKFLCSYTFGPDEYGIEIDADSEAEAWRRLRAIGATGRVDGRVVVSLPVPALPIGRVLRWLRGLLP